MKRQITFKEAEHDLFGLDGALKKEKKSERQQRAERLKKIGWTIEAADWLYIAMVQIHADEMRKAGCL